ncbi:acyltransferase [Ilyomonas limi]|uniref:Acyltransferase n=1 Tax=Ilyomonas limi TaxID=2575867 RepID=A0A4V5UTG7_9BACT|nr:acyltransferase [Ilyomonas limi]TKK65013.1 acyltransferase [Ilyomonas limi]
MFPIQAPSQTHTTPASEQQASDAAKSTHHAVHLKGLNGFRAMAALAVIYMHLANVFDYKVQSGSLGVTVFFTLSGFLITYLLLLEMKRTQTVAIKKFYVRRVLRIWPMYYLYMIIAILATVFIYTERVEISHILYYIFFMANAPSLVENRIELMYHYWSLAVEEQFYLFWPLAIRLFSKRFVPFCLLLIGVMFGARVAVNVFYGTDNPIYILFYSLRFDCMAIGGLAAYLYFQKSKYITIIQHKAYQWVAWLILLLALLDFFRTFRILDHEIIAVITAILIVNQVSNPKTIISLENKLFDQLGKLSYGIYLIHPLIIALLILVYQKYEIPFTGICILHFPLITITLTYLCAYVCYHFFEHRFIKMKQQFAPVKSSSSI